MKPFLIVHWVKRRREFGKGFVPSNAWDWSIQLDVNFSLQFCVSRTRHAILSICRTWLCWVRFLRKHMRWLWILFCECNARKNIIMYLWFRLVLLSCVKLSATGEQRQCRILKEKTDETLGLKSRFQQVWAALNKLRMAFGWSLDDRTTLRWALTMLIKSLGVSQFIFRDRLLAFYNDASPVVCNLSIYSGL